MAAAVAPPPAPTPGAALLEYADYSRWATSSLGVTIAPGLALVPLPAPHWRGVVATSSHRAGATLLSVPLASALALPSLTGTPLGDAIAGLRRAGRARGTPLLEDTALALTLLYEKHVLGGTGKWGRHVAALPHGYDLPFFWSQEELAAWEGTALAVVGPAMQAQSVQDHAELLALLAGAGYPLGLTAEVVTLEEFRWALAGVWSRCLSLRVGVDDAGAPITAKHMLPWFDMLNHEPGSAVRHKFDERKKCISVITDVAIPAGAHVCLNYGQLSNESLMRLYGMVLPVRPLPSQQPAAGEVDENGAPPPAPPPRVLTSPLLSELERYTLLVSMEKNAEAFDSRLALAVKHVGVQEAAAVAAAGPLRGTVTGFGPDDHVAILTVSEERAVVSFELREGLSHPGLLRLLRIQSCETARLEELAGIMAQDPDAGLGLEMEVELLRSLRDALGNAVTGYGETLPSHNDAVRNLTTHYEAGVAASARFAEAVAELAGGDDEGDGFESLLETGRSKKKARRAPRVLPPPPPALPPTVFRTAAGALLRDSDLRILTSQLRLVVNDLDELKEVYEAFCAETERMQAEAGTTTGAGGMD